MRSEETHSQLTQNLLQRTKDSVVAVRAEAVQALARLQDAASEDCEVVQELVRVLDGEASK